jgi:hypothetical protein
MPPILGISRDLHMAGKVMEEVGIILEHQQKAYTFGHDPWD